MLDHTAVAEAAQTSSVCFGCGPDHPHGLRLRFETAGDGSVSASWTPTQAWQGFSGIIHGGIVSTVLDEAMAKAVAVSGAALTAELRVRFRLPVVPGEELRIRGWVAERTTRVTRAEATLVSLDGCEHAHGWSVFLPAQSSGK